MVYLFLNILYPHCKFFITGKYEFTSRQGFNVQCFSDVFRLLFEFSNKSCIFANRNNFKN